MKSRAPECRELSVFDSDTFKQWYSYGDMNAFAPVETLGNINSEFLTMLKGEVKDSAKDARGPPSESTGKASREIGQYTKEQYEDFGWVRENNVVSAGYWKNFTENFAQAIAGKYKYPKNRQGEYMISVYNVYDDLCVADVIVFASGAIESPNVTKIIKINSSDSFIIEETRRDIYEIERRGIQQAAGGILRCYNKTDFVLSGIGRSNGKGNAQYNNRLNTKRSRSEIKANPIIKYHIDEERNTVTTIYANGESVTRSLGAKTSQDLEFFEFLSENVGEDNNVAEAVSVSIILYGI